MSADLFAEFGSSQPQAKAQAQAQAQAPQPFPPFHPGHPKKPSTQTTPSTAADPFAFLGSGLSSPHATAQQTQQWPSLPQSTQPINNDPWGGFASGGPSAGPGVQTQKDAFDDDEDGWGDFETAEPAAQPVSQPAPRSAPQPAPRSAPQPAPQPAPPSVTPAPRPGYVASAPKPLQNISAASKPLQNPSLVRTRVVRASTIELMTNSLIDLPGANALPEEIRSPPWARQSFSSDAQRSSISSPKAPSPKPQPKVAPKADANVLFDADDFGGGEGGNDDDDFGDFETVASMKPPASNDLISDDLFTPPATARKAPVGMLSSLNLNAPLSPYPQAPKSPSFQQRNPFPGLALNTPTEPKAPGADDPVTSPVTAWPTMDHGSAGSNKLDSHWGAFEDLPGDSKPKPKPKPKTVTVTKKASQKPTDDWDWDAFDDKPAPKKSAVAAKPAHDTDSSWAWDAVEPAIDTKSPADDNRAPPLNVPPPSVLLSIFPQLLSQANEALYKPISGQAFSVKNRILSDPKTIEFLRGYLMLATVAARVIAGRKQRWHRDKFLAQGMSISAAGSKGMKLAGIDKTQAAREDREAGDVLDLWKEHVGRLRSSVAAANSSIKDASQHIKIPELRENMTVQTAKGVMQAPKACVICGLKRDERLPRVDLDVEDSFGEWWVEHWGHTACKRFWLQHEGALRQR
jgi:hypothetical protein